MSIRSGPATDAGVMGYASHLDSRAALGGGYLTVLSAVCVLLSCTMLTAVGLAQTDKEYLSASCAEVARKFTSSAQADDMLRNDFLQGYKGKLVRWSGTVSRIRETLWGMEIGVQCLAGSRTKDVSISFDAAWKPKLAQLSTGQQVQFTGQLDDLSELGGISVKQGELGTGRVAEAPSAVASPTASSTPPASGTQVAVGTYSRPQSSPAIPSVWRNSLGIEFVRIPAGEFMMGSNDGDADEKPEHMVRISKPFYLGKYEVTQGQWQAIMGKNPSYFKGDPKLPVKNVSWEDVWEFIRRLNVREGGAQYRLPTEAEWEYAAQAGTTTAYSFGDDARQLWEHAWYGENSERKTHPVGQQKPNPWGLYDVHGNVWEWIQDWYGPYTAGSAVDPAGSSAGSNRVARGGGGRYGARSCRSAARLNVAPDHRSADLGFRLLRTAE